MASFQLVGLLLASFLLQIAGSEQTVPTTHEGLSTTARVLPKHGFVANKCVFILATGHSGSTALMDALNQLPNYLIRGEQYAAIWNIYESYMNFNWTIADPLSQLKFNWSERPHATFKEVKDLYDKEAVTEKLPWFNEFNLDRIMAAARTYYAILYGYYGKGFVSGFKDSRYVCGESFESWRCAEVFNGFMTFLRKLCLDVKVVFNTRTSDSFESNTRLFHQMARFSVDEFSKNLKETHRLFNDYAKNNPDLAFHVFYEEMYDAQKNATLARNLLQFLKEDPSFPIRFTRMPASRS
ncbi:hypothetical protein Agub_g14456 [Astrephomene gubernaculifera]|uniref:Sulfotransferase n=1 Tax=Astrephomene gubernaculifera TaxID=47775 RepID=A0AAD3HTE9_9CHLO|nr:hypothetical protein Agub_g14456 [Astrephomene gubernaculifera]